ncbi:MAG: NADH-quinone oxidoreductase subunit H, partial [Saccharopolyspora rectivirgula]
EKKEEGAPLSGSGYPVPPLDLQVPEPPPRRTPARTAAARQDVEIPRQGAQDEEAPHGTV